MADAQESSSPPEPRTVGDGLRRVTAGRGGGAGQYGGLPLLPLRPGPVLLDRRGGHYPDDPSLTIDQGGAHRGQWVDEYSMAVTTRTGTAQLPPADAGSGAPGETVTASVVSLKCT
jgi:hypothetical protein